jgi:hypothetical protein
MPCPIGQKPIGTDDALENLEHVGGIVAIEEEVLPDIDDL